MMQCDAMITTTADEYLATAEAAAVLRTSPATVSRWAKRGILRPAFRVGNAHVFLTADVHKLAEARRITGATS